MSWLCRSRTNPKSKDAMIDDGSFASFSESRREKGEVFASTVTEPESVWPGGANNWLYDESSSEVDSNLYVHADYCILAD